MTDRVNNTSVRMHGPLDTYDYSDDNAPLEALAKNDVILQKQVDLLYEKLNEGADASYTKSEFPPLRPHPNANVENELYVEPGSFVCRMPTRSGPMDVVKSKGSGINTARGGSEEDRGLADTTAANEFHEMGESQRTSVVYFNGGGVKFDPWSDDDFNWTGHLYQDPDPPDHRMDLVCVQGFPSGDQFGTHNTVLGKDGISWLVVIKGAGFRNTPLFDDDGNNVYANQLSNGNYKEEDIKITMSRPRNSTTDPDFDHAADTGVSKYRYNLNNELTAGLKTARTYGMGNKSVEEKSSTRTYGTIPAPDDIVNSSYHIPPGLDDNFQAILSSTTNVTDVNTGHDGGVGLFTVPIAYVKIPKGYAGTSVESSWIQDIRPLFRSAELTLSERQSISNGYRARATNRYFTIRDSEYQYLVNYILQEDQWNRYELRGQRDISIGNHEGRLRAMEAVIDRPLLQAAPSYSRHGDVCTPNLTPPYPKSYQSVPDWGQMWGAGPILNDNSYGNGGVRYGFGMYFQRGQFIPCVRNYLDRFYSTRYDSARWAESKSANPHGVVDQIFGADGSQVRRVQVRKKFLTYMTDVWEYDTWGNYTTTTKYPVAAYMNENNRKSQVQCFHPNSPAKLDDSNSPAHSRYKFQQVEIDLIFPSWDPERDAVEECVEVWQESHHDGRGWSGFGHGGSRTDTSKWVTVCTTYGGGRTVQAEFPHWGVPLGIVPYFVDVDALGFVPGSIDSLNIDITNLVDTAKDRGAWMHYRFNARPPLWNGINEWESRDSEVVLGPASDEFLTLDERSGRVDIEGNVGFEYGAVGETQTFETLGGGHENTYSWKYKVNQLSPGYCGFCILVHMPIISTTVTNSVYHGWFDHIHNFFLPHWHHYTTTTTGVQYAAKRAKITISGPAHRYLNGAYLPYTSNSDQGGTTPYGASWID